MPSSLLIASLVLTILAVSTQETVPNTTPPTTTKEGAISKFNGQKKADKTEQTDSGKPKDVPCNQCLTCCSVEQPQGKSKEEHAKADSLDRLYRRYMWATIIGVVGAFIGIGVLIWQTRIAGRSARAAEIAAKAAKASVDTLIDSERAWVNIRPDAFQLIICARLDWVLINTGRTTARITEVRVRCKKYGPSETLDPTPVFRTDPILFPRVPLAPQDTLNVWSYIEAGEDRTYDGLTQQSIGEIRERGHDLVAYASVSYLDSFGKPHVARFCYYFATFCDQFRINLKAPSTYHECD